MQQKPEKFEQNLQNMFLNNAIIYKGQHKRKIYKYKRIKGEMRDKIFKNLGLAGLIFLGVNTINTIESKAQYSQSGWKSVTENELNRLKISKDSIQLVDLTKNKDSPRYTDNSKRGKIFIDVSGAKYFWYNPNPTNEFYFNNNYNYSSSNGNNFDRGREILYDSKVEEKLTKEQQLEALINEPEIKNLIKDFNSNFQVRWRYYVLGEDIYDSEIKSYRKKGDEVFSNILKINKYQYGTILKDKKTQKEVLVVQSTRLDLGSNLESFLNELSTLGTEYLKDIFKRLLSYGERDNPQIKLNTLEEKKNFIRPYFTDSIPNAIKNLPKYNPPIIYINEFERIKGKEPVKENIKLENSKSAKSIEMNEKKLDEILKEND